LVVNKNAIPLRAKGKTKQKIKNTPFLSIYLDIGSLALVLRGEHDHGPVLDVHRPEELLAAVVPHSTLGLDALVVGVAYLRGLDHLAFHLHHAGLYRETELL
jgi:hypothetical protein